MLPSNNQSQSAMFYEVPHCCHTAPTRSIPPSPFSSAHLAFSFHLRATGELLRIIKHGEMVCRDGGVEGWFQRDGKGLERGAFQASGGAGTGSVRIRLCIENRRKCVETRADAMRPMPADYSRNAITSSLESGGEGVKSMKRVS